MAECHVSLYVSSKELLEGYLVMEAKQLQQDEIYCKDTIFVQVGLRRVLTVTVLSLLHLCLYITSMD